MRTRRQMLAMPLVACAGALLATCKQQSQVSKPGEQVVEFMDWGEIANTPLETVLTNFGARFPQIKVDVQPVPADYENKMRAMLAAGVAPDIMRVNDDYVRGYTLKEQLVDLILHQEKWLQA